MRIESSVTGMESERSYSAVSCSARSLKLNIVSGGGSVNAGMPRGRNGGRTGFADTLSGKREAAGAKEAGESSATKGTSAAEAPALGKEDYPSEKSDFGYGRAGENKMASVTDIMDRMMSVNRYPGVSLDVRDAGTDIYARKMSVLYIFSLLFGEFRSRIDELMAGVRKEYEGEQAVVRMDMTQENIYREREETSFTARGKAKCADGREIDFDINVGMSRSFEKISKERMVFDPVRCMDPLVINLREGVTSVSDQYIYFDLDGDGESERIKALSENSGYIALDNNGDGIINDGTELFGTKSGDGFADLAVHDSDGDGWIDEDDEIFDKLRIWVRGEDGTESLLSFKEAGVGAINLARSQTEFSIKDELNRFDAIIRSTGMFLYEDGCAGTVQQVDMVS